MTTTLSTQLNNTCPSKVSDCSRNSDLNNNPEPQEVLLNLSITLVEEALNILTLEVYQV